MGLSSLQDPLVRPTVSVELDSLVSSELLQGLGEIVAEDTNNVMVQVVIILYSTSISLFMCSSIVAHQ